MEIVDPIIKFTGTLLDRNREEIDGLNLRAEFFNLATNTWETLIDSFTVLSGNINRSIDLGEDEFKTDETYESLYDALEVGNIPLTRISLEDIDADMPAHVVGLGGDVKFTEENNRITIGFSSLYYIDPYTIQQGSNPDDPEGTYKLVTIPEPLPMEGNELFPAILAALNQTESFNEFTIEDHTVVVRPNDEEFEDCEAAINELTDTLAERDEELETKTALITDLEGSLAGENEKVVTLTNTLAERDAELETKTELITGLEGELAGENEKVETLTNELTVERTNLIRANKLLDLEKAKVTELQRAIDAKNAAVAKLEANIAECRVDVERLEEEKLDILDRDATPANEVYKSIVRELETATEESTESRFTVSNLSLNLKTHIVNDGDGFKLQLIDSARADYVTDGTISDIQLDIISQDLPNSAPTEIIMPTVNGLTETATRKRLTSFGLLLKPIYQASTTQTIGQAFKQTPEAGTEVTVGDTITVIFAKDTENFN